MMLDHWIGLINRDEAFDRAYQSCEIDETRIWTDLVAEQIADHRQAISLLDTMTDQIFEYLANVERDAEMQQEEWEEKDEAVLCFGEYFDSSPDKDENIQNWTDLAEKMVQSGHVYQLDHFNSEKGDYDMEARGVVVSFWATHSLVDRSVKLYMRLGGTSFWREKYPDQEPSQVTEEITIFGDEEVDITEPLTRPAIRTPLSLTNEDQITWTAPLFDLTPQVKPPKMPSSLLDRVGELLEQKASEMEEQSRPRSIPPKRSSKKPWDF